MNSLLASTDPLFSHGTTGVVILIAIIKVLVGFGALMGSVILMIWFERKAISDMPHGLSYFDDLV